MNRYEAFACRVNAGDWRVEGPAMDDESEFHVTVFCGRDCEGRAKDYAIYLNGYSSPLVPEPLRATNLMKLFGL